MPAPDKPATDTSEIVSPSEENATDTRRLGLKFLLRTLALSLTLSNCMACSVACGYAAVHFLLRVTSPPWLDPSGMFKSASLLGTAFTTRHSGWLIYIPRGLIASFVPLASASEHKPSPAGSDERTAEVRRWWARVTAPVPPCVVRVFDLGLIMAAGPLGALLQDGRDVYGEVGLDPWHATIASVVLCVLVMATSEAGGWMLRCRSKRCTTGVTDQKNRETEQMEKGLEHDDSPKRLEP
ncbi:hypothetical protein BD310DRAFT_912612 [Dichomitus squalens]|uniref:Uncharacterized protein n=1 Tax=Dichomitus squalens TaxID=114155 RepID=A0A4Q9QDY2_9APHY|nr:hypothetical protein BD310DRAFT_912612 [Dichomitus squalens]